MITPDLVVFYLANIIKMSQTDGKMNPKAEREEIQGFVEKVHVTEQQVQAILMETKIKIDLQITCFSSKQDFRQPSLILQKLDNRCPV